MIGRDRHKSGWRDTRPSIRKGVVTIPIVNVLVSLAILATIVDEPVPVLFKSSCDEDETGASYQHFYLP